MREREKRERWRGRRTKEERRAPKARGIVLCIPLLMGPLLYSGEGRGALTPPPRHTMVAAKGRNRVAAAKGGTS
jgi:hypothetical protein